MRDQPSPSPVYTSFISSILFVILTSSSSSSSPSLLPPFQRANPIPVGRSGHDFITRLGSRGSFLATPRTPRSLARSLAGPFFKSHSAPPRRAEVGIRPSTMSFLIHSYPYPMHPMIHTEECSTPSIDAKGFVCPPTRCLSDGMTAASIIFIIIPMPHHHSAAHI